MTSKNRKEQQGTVIHALMKSNAVAKLLEGNKVLLRRIETLERQLGKPPAVRDEITSDVSKLSYKKLVELKREVDERLSMHIPTPYKVGDKVWVHNVIPTKDGPPLLKGVIKEVFLEDQGGAPEDPLYKVYLMGQGNFAFCHTNIEGKRK